jgi:hypothetical protein
MHVVAADPRPIPSADTFVIGPPAGGVEFLLPLARLVDLLESVDDDRPSLLGSIATLLGITTATGVCIAAVTLGLALGAGLLR